MKKLYLLLLTFICLFSLCINASNADCGCKKQVPFWNKICQKPCQKPCENVCEKPCPQPCETPCSTDGFLCRNISIDELAKCMKLSNPQLCNAHKINEKYEQEVLSYNDRIQCEKQKYAELEQSCAASSELRKQKRTIKNYEKETKKICECYEKQFKATLSRDQEKQYNKAKKGR